MESRRLREVTRPDKRRKATCVKTCAQVWPQLFLPKGAKPVAKGKAKASLLGSDRDPAGGQAVTYAGWPLYTYAAGPQAWRRQRPGTEPQWRPLVRALTVRQGDPHQAVRRTFPHSLRRCVWRDVSDRIEQSGREREERCSEQPLDDSAAETKGHVGAELGPGDDADR